MKYYIQRQRGARDHVITHGTTRLKCSQMKLELLTAIDHFMHGLVYYCNFILVQWEFVKAFQRSDMIIVAVWKDCAGSSVENDLGVIKLEPGIQSEDFE